MARSGGIDREEITRETRLTGEAAKLKVILILSGVANSLRPAFVCPVPLQATGVLKSAEAVGVVSSSGLASFCPDSSYKSRRFLFLCGAYHHPFHLPPRPLMQPEKDAGGVKLGVPSRTSALHHPA
jgi:hypothetical protein